MKPKRSKFNVDLSKAGKLRRTLDGVVYDSAAERDYAAELEHRVKTHQISKWQRQHPFPLWATTPGVPFGKKVCNVVVDFLVTLPNGKEEVHEVKGHETEVWKLKRKLFEANYPNIPYRVIKKAVR